MTDLAVTGEVRKDTIRVYALGRVGLWSEDGRVKKLSDLAGARVKHIAIPNPKHAPYGIAAEEVLRRAGLLEQVRSKLVYGENVRQAFEFARSGNADAVLTSWTLMVDKAGILIPESLHEPVRQAGGVVASSKRAQVAGAFLEFLVSAEGQSILKKFGFARPRP